jgi:FtsP/CotA-like multicopper oxidase with cupredoxin domain
MYSVSRRGFLLGSGGLAAAAAWPLAAAGAAKVREVRIVAAPGEAPLLGRENPRTPVWAYNRSVPGPEIRARQGERLRVTVENRLAEETTVHWHGLRVPNSMDGVPDLTQKPIAPGATFAYEFDLPDAGTYWYHPHQRGFEQVGRGLYGPLIVEERDPVLVDRDVTWVLDDWRLLPTARISDDFGNFHDVSHSGRIGNIATVNGLPPRDFSVRAGERVRLRLINAANARNFGLEFQGHHPKIIAYDGQPVAPHEPPGGRVVLGPAMRADVILDMAGRPGDRLTVRDTFYKGLEFRVMDLVYEGTPIRSRPLDASVVLAANTMPEPDLARAQRHEITFGGGMMGRMSMAMMDGRRVGLREMMHHGKAWAINGVAATGHVLEPLLVLDRGRTYVLALHNDTAWFHPIHLHGHSFRVISRNGHPTAHKEWRDTVLLAPRERAEIAFVADNPGDWMFHCHVLEHMAGGMMGVIRVA